MRPPRRSIVNAGGAPVNSPAQRAGLLKGRDKIAAASLALPFQGRPVTCF
jgi:hypothetical protein